MLLVFLLGLPALLVPLLLTGRASETEICLVTLERRTNSWLAIGSLALAQPEWSTMDGWPQPQLHPSLLKAVGNLPDAGPGAWRRRMGMQDADHIYMDIERTMPFALVVGIPNLRALDPRRANIVEVRLLAAAVLDPESVEDRTCFQKLDKVLSEGLEQLPGLRGRERRRPPVTSAEVAAGRILGECLDLLDEEDPSAAVRAVLCRAGEDNEGGTQTNTDRPR